MHQIPLKSADIGGLVDVGSAGAGVAGELANLLICSDQVKTVDQKRLQEDKYPSVKPDELMNYTNTIGNAEEEKPEESDWVEILFYSVLIEFFVISLII